MRYLSWLWLQEKSVARTLALAIGVLLTCAPAFAAFEIASLDTVQEVHPPGPAIVMLGAGRHALLEDVGADDFPAGEPLFAVAGPAGPVPVQESSQGLGVADLAEAIGDGLLGLHDSAPIAWFTVTRPGPYRVTIADPGVGALWITEPSSVVAIQVTPWAAGVAGSLLTIAFCLALPRRRWRGTARAERN